MSPIHADDLPADVRSRLGIEPKKKGRRNTGKGARDGDPCPGSCASCSMTFDRYTAWERHAATTGHARWIVELADADGAGHANGV